MEDFSCSGRDEVANEKISAKNERAEARDDGRFWFLSEGMRLRMRRYRQRLTEEQNHENGESEFSTPAEFLAC